MNINQNKVDVNEQYELIMKLNGLELKAVSLIICTKPGAKYQLQSWTKSTKCAAYIIKELSNSGQLYNISTSQLVESLGEDISKKSTNSLLVRLQEGGYIDKYPMIKTTEDKLTSENIYTTDKYQYTLIPTEKLLDLLDEYNIPYPDRNLICKYRNKAIQDTKKIKVSKTVECGVKTTITTTTDAYGNRTLKKEVDVNEAQNQIKDLNEQIDYIQTLIDENGQEENIKPVKPIVNIGEENCDWNMLLLIVHSYYRNECTINGILFF